MIFNEQLAEELDRVITTGLDRVAIPYEKGNSIRLKHIAIRKHKKGYKLFDCKTNSHIVTTFTKAAALAIAKLTIEQKQEHINSVMNFDDRASKYYMDAVFAKRSYENSKNNIKKDTAEIQFDIAMEKCWTALEAIETFIFDK